MWSRDIGLLTTPANINRIWQLSPKGGWAGGSPTSWVGRWGGGGGAVTNFHNRVCDNKASCKKSAHLDQKWARNGCFKFSRLFRGGGSFIFFSVQNRITTIIIEKGKLAKNIMNHQTVLDKYVPLWTIKESWLYTLMNHQTVLARYITLWTIKQSWQNIYPYEPSNSLGEIYNLMNHQTVMGKYIPLWTIKQSWQNTYPYEPSNCICKIYTLMNHQTVLAKYIPLWTVKQSWGNI